MTDFILNLDLKLFRYVNGLSSSFILDHFMVTISASMPWILISIFLIFYSVRKRRRDLLTAFLFAIIALSLADLVSFEVIKPFVKRERPCWVLASVRMVGGHCGGSYGFTSNHAANAAAVFFAMVLSKVFSRKILAFTAAAAILVGTSRVYLGVHYPTDIVGGVLLGAAIAYLLKVAGAFEAAAWVCKRLIKSV